MKTSEEIQALKDAWEEDACWDIEDTEGFEEHHDELLAYREQKEAQWKIEGEKRILREKEAFYSMDLHAFKTIGEYEAMRVPGGWIYTYIGGESDLIDGYHPPNLCASVFVPYHSEFKPKE